MITNCCWKGVWLLSTVIVGGCATSHRPVAVAVAVAAPPTVGIGPFHLGMTRKDAEQLVKPEELGEGEENGRRSITVFLMDPAKRIVLLLDERGKVRSLAIHGDRSAWRLAHHVSLGTRLSALARINGQPVRLQAFDTSANSGRVLDWRGGALATEFVKVRMTFASPWRAPGYGRMSETQKLELEKNRQFLSSDAELAALDPWLETIVIEQ